MTPNKSHVAGLELAKKAMEQQRERYGGVHKASLACLDGLIEIAKSAPAEPGREAVAWIVTDMNGDSYFAYDRQTPRDTPLYTAPPSPDAELVSQCIAEELSTWEGDFQGPVQTAMRCLQVRIDAKLASLKP